MSAVSQGHPAQEHEPRATGPGHLLRSARESAGITLRDVAAQLRLDERTVTALENDDFEHLPAPTFVRGYLRGYARLLGVPVGPVMEAYDREGFTPPDLVADIAEHPEASTGDVPVRLATFAVVLVLAILVVLWWNNQAFDELPSPVAERDRSADSPPPLPPSEPSAPASATSPSATAAPGPATPAPATPPPAPSIEASAVSPPAPDGTGPGATSPQDRDTASPAAAVAVEAERVIAQAEGVLERARSEVAAVVAEPQPVVPQAREEPAGGAAATAQPSPVPEPPAPRSDAPSAPAPATASRGQLVMQFPVEAWVEVYDRDGKRLFFDLAKPGRTIDLTGEPPLRVLLGRTTGVTVRYEGRDVDLTPFTERGVARFTVGE